MGKMFGIIAVVVALWATAEIYNEGSTNAFGGLLTRTGMVEAPAPSEEVRVGERVGSKVGSAHNEADDRRNRMLNE
jgi:hypothetical protein